MWIHETPIFEAIFVTLTENSSVITDDTQGIRSIHTPWHSCKEACPRINMAQFCLLMEKSLKLLLPRLVLMGLDKKDGDGFLEGWRDDNPMHSMKVTGQDWEGQKRISINTISRISINTSAIFDYQLLFATLLF